MGVAAAALSSRDHRIQLTQARFRRVGLRCQWGSAWTSEQLLGMWNWRWRSGIHPGVGWGQRSTAEREMQGEESRDPGVIPEEFLCEQGSLQKYLLAHLPSGF